MLTTRRASRGVLLLGLLSSAVGLQPILWDGAQVNAARIALLRGDGVWPIGAQVADVRTGAAYRFMTAAAHRLLGDAARSEGNQGVALREYRASWMARPDHSVTAYFAGIAAWDVGDVDAARQFLSQGRAAEAVFREAEAAVRSAASDAGRWVDLAAQLEVSGHSTRRACLLADALLGAGDASTAWGFFDRALRAGDQELPTVLGWGRAALAAGAHREVPGRLAPYAEQFPHDSELRFLIGDAYIESGDLGRALNWYLDGTADGMTRPGPNLRLGYLLLREGATQHAVEVLGGVVAREPNNSDASFRLAQALRDMGDLVAARGHALMALTLRPDIEEYSRLLRELQA